MTINKPLITARMFFSIGLLCLVGAAQATPTDPLKSPMWDYLRDVFIGDAPYQFDASIKVSVPAFAEDPTQVPITVDANAIAQPIEKIVVWADLNPIQHIYTYYPHHGIRPKISVRIKVQQGTAVRAAVLLKSGDWRIGSAYLDASGGGCTTPSVANADPYWESHLGEISGKKFVRNDGGRYKLKVIHPMDTGLVNNIPEFYIQQLELRDDSKQALLRMELSQPVSENPVFSFDVISPDASHRLWMRDNNGNEFEQQL